MTLRGVRLSLRRDDFQDVCPLEARFRAGRARAAFLSLFDTRHWSMTSFSLSLSLVALRVCPLSMLLDEE